MDRQYVGIDFHRRRSVIVRKDTLLRPTTGGDRVEFATKLALRMLGRQFLDLKAAAEQLDAQLEPLVRATAPHSSNSTESGSTPLRSCWSPRVTTPIVSGQKPRGRTCAVSRHSQQHRARPSTVIASIGAGTGKRTMRCGGSCSPA